MKVLSAESNLASATNVGNSTVVRVYNSDSSAGTITKKDAAGNTLGTMTVPAGEVVYCEKQYTDTLEGGATLKASQIAYSNMMYYASAASSGGGWSGVSSNLIGRYDFADTNTFEPGGTAVNDLSGNGINGTKNSDHGFPQHVVTFSGTDIGNTMLFAQQQSEISFGGNFPPSSAADISMFTWFYPTGFSNFYNVIFSKDGASSNWDFALMMKNVGGNYRLTVQTGVDYDSHGLNMAINNWYYLGFTLDGPNSDLKIYVSTSSFDSSPTTHSNEGRGPFDSTKPFHVGEERSFNAGAAGHMSQLQIYDRVLTPAEVEQNYNADKVRYGY